MPAFIQEKLKTAKNAADQLASITEEEKRKKEAVSQQEGASKEQQMSKEESVSKQEGAPEEESVPKQEGAPQEESTPKQEGAPNENDTTLNEDNATSQTPATDAATATVTQESENLLTAQPKPETESKPPTQPPTITSAERSKALAQSRLLLQQTVASISEMCQLDAKKDQNYREVMVETSENQKIWKDQSEKKGGYGFFQKKYDSTIEQSDDFKKFMERKAKEKEELSNRPKPPPGGGQVADASGSSEGKEGLENGQPMAALVLHLLEKNRASKSKKDAKKPVKETQKKLKKTGILAQGRGKASENVEGPKRNRKKRQAGNKKAGKNRSSAVTESDPFPALNPAMILKPGMN